MKQLRHIPLFKLAVCFIAGIFLSSCIGWLTVWISIPALLAFAVSILLDRRWLSPHLEYLQAGFVYFSAIGLGAAMHLSYSWQPGAHIEHVNCRKVELEGVVWGKVKQNEYGQRAWLKVEHAFIEDTLYPVHGHVQMYLKPEHQWSLEPHQKLRIIANVRNIRSSYPSYLKYLHQQGIFHAAYVDSLQFVGIEKNIVWYCSRIQQWYAAKIDLLIPDKAAGGIAKAMFVGDKSELQPESRETFAAVGASHILAISGLHVGIIYLLLSWIFRPLHLVRNGKRIKNILILIILLAYMGITGATPAVIRAVLMFAAILLFDIWYQRYHILNILALSAFVQIFWDTHIVFSISFQLSYCAVAGIVLLYPVFERYFATENPVLQKLFSCMGVTICATLATTPLVLLYFGQFPTYFLLTNILIALITAGTVFVGFVMVLFIWVPYFSELCGYICYLLLTGLHAVCNWIAAFPYAIIDSFSLNEPGLFILGLELMVALGILMLPRLLRFLATRSAPLTLEKAGI